MTAMPAQTVARGKRCEKCGAEVREKALYCYSCGNALRRQSGEVTERRSEPAPGLFNSDKLPPVPKPIEELYAESPVYRSDAPPPPDTAAQGRQMVNAATAEVEAEWVVRERPPTLFYVTCITVFAVALTLLVLALYLR